MVSEKDVANLTRAPMRRSQGGPNWEPAPGFDSFVQADLHYVGKEGRSSDQCIGLWLFIIHGRKTVGQGCFKTLLLARPIGRTGSRCSSSGGGVAATGRGGGCWPKFGSGHVAFVCVDKVKIRR